MNEYGISTSKFLFNMFQQTGFLQHAADRLSISLPCQEQRQVVGMKSLGALIAPEPLEWMERGDLALFVRSDFGTASQGSACLEPLPNAPVRFRYRIPGICLLGTTAQCSGQISVPHPRDLPAWNHCPMLRSDFGTASQGSACLEPLPNAPVRFRYRIPGICLLGTTAQCSGQISVPHPRDLPAWNHCPMLRSDFGTASQGSACLEPLPNAPVRFRYRIPGICPLGTTAQCSGQISVPHLGTTAQCSGQISVPHPRDLPAWNHCPMLRSDFGTASQGSARLEPLPNAPVRFRYRIPGICLLGTTAQCSGQISVPHPRDLPAWNHCPMLRSDFGTASQGSACLEPLPNAPVRFRYRIPGICPLGTTAQCSGQISVPHPRDLPAWNHCPMLRSDFGTASQGSACLEPLPNAPVRFRYRIPGICPLGTTAQCSGQISVPHPRDLPAWNHCSMLRSDFGTASQGSARLEPLPNAPVRFRYRIPGICLLGTTAQCSGQISVPHPRDLPAWNHCPMLRSDFGTASQGSACLEPLPNAPVRFRYRIPGICPLGTTAQCSGQISVPHPRDLPAWNHCPMLRSDFGTASQGSARLEPLPNAPVRFRYRIPGICPLGTTAQCSGQISVPHPRDLPAWNHCPMLRSDFGTASQGSACLEPLPNAPVRFRYRIPGICLLGTTAQCSGQISVPHPRDLPAWNHCPMLRSDFGTASQGSACLEPLPNAPVRFRYRIPGICLLGTTAQCSGQISVPHPRDLPAWNHCPMLRSDFGTASQGSACLEPLPNAPVRFRYRIPGICLLGTTAQCSGQISVPHPRDLPAWNHCPMLRSDFGTASQGSACLEPLPNAPVRFRYRIPGICLLGTTAQCSGQISVPHPRDLPAWNHCPMLRSDFGTASQGSACLEPLPNAPVRFRYRIPGICLLGTTAQCSGQISVSE